MLDRLANMIRSAITRGKVVSAVIGARTVLQVTGLDNEVLNGVELLLPPGYSARPVAGADVLILQVLGSRDHLVILGGDNAGADAITNLAAGEIGLRNATANIQIVLRNTGTVEITAPTVSISGDLHVAGAVIAGYGGADQVGLQTHDHKQPPDSHGDTEAATNPPTPGT